MRGLKTPPKNQNSPRVWWKVKLGEVALLNPKVDLEKGSEYPYIPMEVLDWNTKYVSGIKLKKYKGGVKFKEGDVLFARITPCLENGKIGRAKDLNGKKGFGSTEYFVVRGKGDVSDTDFLYYLARTHKLRQTAINSMVGVSGRQRARIESLENYEFYLPDLITQKHIASVLSAFDDKIEINNKINQTLEKMAQAIFKEWFIKNEKLSKEASVKQIKDFGKVITGKTPSTREVENFGSEIPFITIPDMRSTFITKTERSLSATGKGKMRSLLLPSGSICVSCIATIGLVCITTEESVTNQQVNSIIPEKPEYTYFLYHFLKRSKKVLEAIGAGGSTTFIINKTQFENLEVPTADDQKINKFHQVVEPMYKKVLEIIKENQKLTALRDLLLPKLMRGEIKV